MIIPSDEQRRYGEYIDRLIAPKKRDWTPEIVFVITVINFVLFSGIAVVLLRMR